MADSLEYFLCSCWEVLSADSGTQNSASSAFTQWQVGPIFPLHWSSKFVLITGGKTMNIARRKLRGQLLKSCLDAREHPRPYIARTWLKRTLTSERAYVCSLKKKWPFVFNTHHIPSLGERKKKKVYKSMRCGTHLFLKWYMKCFISWTADLKSSKPWSSQFWTQFKDVCAKFF